MGIEKWDIFLGHCVVCFAVIVQCLSVAVV